MCSDCKTPGSFSKNGVVNSSFLFVVVLPIKYPKQLSDIFPAKDTNEISDSVSSSTRWY